MPKKSKKSQASKDAETRKTDIMLEVKFAIEKYGVEAGPKLIREKYPDVSKPTWYRWLREVRAHPLDAAIDKARKLAEKRLPAVPSPQYLAEKPHESRKNIDMLTRLEALYADAELLRAHAVMTDKNGNDIVRNPMFFSQSIRLRSDLLDNALRALAQVWDLSRMQRLHDLILTEIGKADPDTQRRITAALKELDDRVGITMDARL